MLSTRFTSAVFRVLALLLCFTISHASQAQQWRKEALSPLDKEYMQQQREQIDELAQRHFGRSLNGKKSNDFPIMQRLLTDKIVKPEQAQILQSMGVILGDALKEEHGLSWTVYIDRYGRSKALNIPKQRDVVFPITMISRRFQTGSEVDIEKVYQKAIDNVERLKKQIVVY